MSRKGFTPKGPIRSTANVVSSARKVPVTSGDVQQVADKLDDHRRTDSLEIQRELEEMGKELDALQARSPRTLAFAHILISGGVTAGVQSSNLSVTSVGAVLSLAFGSVPDEYAVSVTSGVSAIRTVYQVTKQDAGFDVEQRDLNDVITAFTGADFELHVSVVG